MGSLGRDNQDCECPQGPSTVLMERLYMALTIADFKRCSHRQSSVRSADVCSHIGGGKEQRWGAVRSDCL